MPVADYATFCAMIDRARELHLCYPAINVTSLQTANAVLKGLADSQCDGIIQISTGGAAHASGTYLKNMPLGAASIAEHVHRVAARLYTTPEDTLEAARRLNAVKGARYLLAATFGNVHGVYKPGSVKLKPSILKDCQDAVEKTYDPRSYMALAETAMAERVKQAVSDLRGVGTTFFKA